MANRNVLSDRYATGAINTIFSTKGKIILERELWIAGMETMNELGVDIPLSEIEKYKAVNIIDLGRLKSIEKKTRHDVKAKLEYFNKIAKAKGAHRGWTSRDLTDNVEQVQIKRAAQIIFGKYVSIVRHFLDKAEEYKHIILTARTHHQPAQPTLLGKRFAMWTEELLHHLIPFELFIANYPLRGIKGPVGTQFDMLNLLGSREKVDAFEKQIAHKLGFTEILHSIGQIYPRSLDYELLSRLALLASACENFAITMRLMSGYELTTEGFKKDQVGSSAMPHKMNTRSSERICGAAELVKMYADGASRISGGQWEEGDVSCSIIRRVVIPDAFYASDCVCETTLTVLNEMGAYPVIIEREVDRYLPFLATTEILGMIVKAGIERETAHKIIQKYATAEALKMRKESIAENNLAKLLTDDPVIRKKGITFENIQAIMSDKIHFIGRAEKQIEDVEKRAKRILRVYHKEARYEPKTIL